MKLYVNKETKLIGSNILGSVILKGVSLIISLALTKQYILYFGNNIILGGWYAIVSILNWMLYFDFGIGNGMRNAIVQPMENKEYKIAQKHISTGYVVTFFISLSIMLVAGTISIFLDWNAILNLPKTEIDNKTLVFMVLVSIFGICLQFFLRTIISIYNAMRKTAVSGFMALLTNAIMYVYLFLAPRSNPAEAIMRIAVVHVIATCLPLIVVTFWAFCFPLKVVRPSIKLYDRESSKSITSLGIQFFIIQIALLLISSTDSWLISHYYAPENVVDYQTYYRFFSIALTVYALFSQTAWSSVTKYYNEKKIKSIKKINLFLQSIAAIGSLACFAVALLFKYIVNIWLSDASTPVRLIPALLFATWMSLEMFMNATTGVANGIGKLKCQAIFIPLGGIIKVLGVAVLSHFETNWYAVLWCNIVCLIPLLIAQNIANHENIKKL